MIKPQVLIADGLGKEGLSQLSQISEIIIVDRSGKERADILKDLKEIQILVVRSRTLVDAELMEHAPQLKVIIRAGIGLDNIDVDAATARAIVVMNAPSGNIVTTAEHTLSLLMAVSRRIPQADALLRQGKWEKKHFQGNELCGKTLGVIGLGNIGRVVANRAQGLGMKVIAHDVYLSQEAAAKLNIRLESLQALLQSADYVTLHVPLTETTQHLIGEKELRLMKPTAYLINCARGGIIDEKALEKVLNEGKLQGCALDVFEKEPPGNHPLFRFPNTVFTPHLGASTDEAQTQVSLEVADQIAQYVQTGAFKNAVNVPNISPEKLTVLRPYLSLCEKLGAFASQLAPEKISSLKVHYSGSVLSLDREPLTLSVLKGFLSPLMQSSVNFVNARNLLKDRGIRVEESFENECRDYAGLITVSAQGEGQVSCAGTLFGKSPRIVQVDQYLIDAVPEGFILFTRNTDQPGVIGRVGAILGNAGVNIARMHLGLDKNKREAIALINVDSKVSAQVVAALRSADGMLQVKQIIL